MSAEDRKIMALLRRYKGDAKAALRENKQLDVLYALAPLRENVLEWYDFDADSSLLQLGADAGALTGLFLRKTGEVTVADPDDEALKLIDERYPSGKKPKTVKVSEDGNFSGAGKNYDYVTMIGTFLPEKSLEQQVKAAASYVKEGGTLFIAVQNRYGMKYLAGTAGDPVTASYEELVTLLPGAEIRYPMPDYRTASEIWSDGMLPTRADVAGFLPLYDYPRYPAFHVGAALASACRDGKFRDFADSYLVIWKKEPQNV